MMLVNIMEMIVDAKIANYLPDMDCCQCEECVLNIKCLALNKLPPKYVSTHKGELFSRVDQTMLRQSSVDIDFAVIQAIDFVKANPRHENQENK
ncbi:MAG: late competence development ComFB family protein [Oscillospiraceae bacterium]|nr:late competence development ComFB family protein [Oscillospiraceae bacterium]